MCIRDSLHAGHLAIDAVCLTKDVSIETSFLLLIQVSLSSYASKGVDIYKRKSSHSEDSIAEHYRRLSSVDDSHVIYVYASPQELNPPTEDTFLRATTQVTTRYGPPRKPYWYGFVLEDSPTAAILKEVKANL